jgi:Asp-tRNA(Asn)/Glu-tRNA(Gln) amidotransferase C subunit
MADQPAPSVSGPVVRVLAEVAGLPVTEDRVAELAEALQGVLAGKAALAELDLTDVEPESAFDPRWD